MTRRPIYCLQIERPPHIEGCIVTLFARSGRNLARLIGDVEFLYYRHGEQALLDEVVASLAARLESAERKARAETTSRRQPGRLADAVLENCENSGQ